MESKNTTVHESIKLRKVKKKEKVINVVSFLEEIYSAMYDFCLIDIIIRDPKNILSNRDSANMMLEYNCDTKKIRSDRNWKKSLI